MAATPYWLSPPYGCARRTLLRQRDARAEARAREATPPSLPERVRRLGELPPGTERLVRALDLALAEGAGDIGDALAAQLEGGLAGMTRRERARALPVLGEWLLRAGHHASALAHAEQHRPLLLESVRGASLLTSLGEPRLFPPTFTLPDGRLDAYLIQAQLDHGALSGDALARLLARHPRASLRQPELLALAHHADRERQPERARRALDAYFHAQGVQAPIPDPAGIAGHRFASPPGRASAAAPLVSVLVAAFDSEATVVAAVDSLLAQDHPNLEVLVCDDASRDGTQALLASRYAREPRVRLFRSLANQGPYNIRNALLREARGELIAYHDADDLALPTRLSSQLRAMRRSGASACFTSWVRVRPSGELQVFRDQGVRRLSLVSLLLERRVLDALGGFRRARFAADDELYKRLLDSPRVRTARVRTPQVLGLWSSQSLTRAAGSESLASGFRAPPRRAYSAAVFEQRLLGTERRTDADVDEVLRRHGVYVEPAGIVALG